MAQGVSTAPPTALLWVFWRKVRAPFIFCLGGRSDDTGIAGQHHPCTENGGAVHPGAWLYGAGERRDPRCVSDAAGGAGAGGGTGLRRPAADAVLCGYAPPRAPVSHAGYGHGLAAIGLAEYLHISHGGAVRRHRLRPAGVPPAGRRPHHQRHHAGVYVLLPAHGGYMDPDGRAGACRCHRLCGEGEHGPQRSARRFAGDDGGVHPGDGAVAGRLSF